jgi:exopolyphosphatase/guanosine-5'-triphosphate,3'-diphosphate pyrophosphatase
MIAEVGGGSTLLTIVRGGEIPASQSFNLGSIRMQEMLSTAGELPERAAELLRQHIEGTISLAKKSLHMRAVRDFVAIGGDARFAAQQAGEKLDGADEVYTVDVKRLSALVDDLVPRRAEDIAREYRLPFADAETLVPALLVYQALLGATRADRIIVSPVTMRDGLLVDLPRYISGEPDPALVHSILLSAKNIGARYQYDAKHAEHVAALAVRLYDAMQKEHGLSPRHRLLLEVAALLHEVGKFVSSRAHHKHSYYLIQNAEILGLKRDDIGIVARVARYHRKAMPKLAHPEYVNLSHDGRMVINKLGAILRVADALDKGHWQQLRGFEVEQQEQELVIYVKGAGDLTLERRAIAAKADLFEEIFGLKVRLEEGAPPGRAGGES